MTDKLQGSKKRITAALAAVVLLAVTVAGIAAAVRATTASAVAVIPVSDLNYGNYLDWENSVSGRITTEEGKLLRVNRSIQAEGAFGQLKHNRKFVRFLTAGNVKVTCELFLLAISQNIRKAIVKCNTGRLENHILQPASLLNF